MYDIRPVGYIVGLLTASLGVLMLLPMATDLVAGNDNWLVFLESAIVTVLVGGLIAVACLNGVTGGLSLQQSYMLTTGAWVVMPAFGALPFMLGAPGVGWVDGYFEAMSGMTTTGATVFVGLDAMPPGTLLWRSLLQWLGGLGIIIVALIFLPVMKVGGMQYFRSEGFDTLGKVLPRALDISKALVEVYLALTLAAAVIYAVLGMTVFDAVNHALTTIATGGFSTSDQSFAHFGAGPSYAAVVLMILSGLPFIRYVQLMNGSLRPLFADIQIRAFLRWIGYATGLVLAYRLATSDVGVELAVRESLFNVVTLFTGTGYSSADVASWGDFPVLVVVLAGFVGACTASTGCSIKVFRYLVLIEAIKEQIRQLRSPNRVGQIRLDGRPLGEDVISSVVVMFTLFIVTFGILAVLLSMTGLETRTAITSAWTSICNVGPAYGPEVGPTGAFDTFPDSAKMLMILGMVLGRLELLTVLVLFTRRFWQG
ncbi:TrkH family potassium uptake protein [Roseicitreum antarcticum]|nr:TrkH family potassium uptake protein [Roseicitreum antarcticum]